MSDDTGDVEPAHEESGLEQTTSDRWDEYSHPSVAIVEVVAAATDRTATELPPIQHAVDSEALDALLTGPGTATVQLRFSYAGTTVSVGSNGSLELAVE